MTSTKILLKIFCEHDKNLLTSLTSVSVVGLFQSVVGMVAS